MTLIFHYTNEGVLISGDEAVLEKATKGTGAIDTALLDISDLPVNAHSVNTLFNKAESTGPIYEEIDGEQVLVGYLEAKRYAALREKFVKMMELQNVRDDEQPVEDFVGITSVNSKPIDA